MRLKLKHITLSLSLLTLAACKEDAFVTDKVPDVGKTPIELSIGGVDAPAMTRAVVTDGDNKTLNPFDTNTKIFMVMKSEYGNNDFDDPDNPHVAKYTVARGDVLVSENDNTNNRSIVKFDATNQRYWDDAHARSSQLDIWAYAQKGQNWTKCTFEVPNSGGSGINAYKDKEYETSNIPNPLWSKGAEGEIYPAIRTWRASHYVDNNASNYRHQDKTTIICQDLLFSNNLTNNKSYNGNEFSDNRLKFDFETRKFPQVGEAHMIFYHAMSKITIHIKKGDGFTNSDPFAFTTGNVKLMGFNTEGLFNIKTGQFEYIHEHYDIPQIYQWSTAADGDTYTLEALVIPNVNGNATGLTDNNSQWNDNSTAKSMEFVIDHNKYEISQDQLYEALKAKPENSTIVAGEKVNLEAGKNYVFTFTVGKQKINNITAQVAQWENVTAEETPANNARIKLQFEERGDKQTSDVAFYKANDNKTTDGIDDNYTTWNWYTGYTNLDASYDSHEGHWTTNYFWESNKDFYHFRAVTPSSKEVNTADSKDYFEISSSSCANADSYDAVAWGAPMLDVADNDVSDASTLKWNYGPTKNGFDADDNNKVATSLPSSTTHQIYKAIGPTEEPVKLILFHMMSGVHFTIKTDDTKADKVELFDDTNRTKVELVGYYKNGKVLLGTGLVNVDGTISTVGTPYNIPFANATNNTHYVNQEYFFSAVPQDLDNVQLVITTPDHNQYIVDLDKVKVTASSISPANVKYDYPTVDGESGKCYINRWIPNTKYTYTFTLKKTGIDNIQATIVNWETVTADDETVQIK